MENCIVLFHFNLLMLATRKTKKRSPIDGSNNFDPLSIVKFREMPLKSYKELKFSSKFSIFQSEIMNDESLAILSKSSTKVFGKCTAEVTLRERALLEVLFPFFIL
ncbi:hypothetical protein EU348_00645 [Chryseobacterium indologenes]|uniref:Uncharacterized protein n=1 Tax=Chryseobacterium indologenes TaxID=253 RepID=A0A411DHI8_CHRID|nr:hypothetical protein EU348_00645 [Chryseobacterium indologenes]